MGELVCYSLLFIFPLVPLRYLFHKYLLSRRVPRPWLDGLFSPEAQLCKALRVNQGLPPPTPETGGRRNLPDLGSEAWFVSPPSTFSFHSSPAPPELP